MAAALPAWVEPATDGLRLRVRVIPNAARPGVVGPLGDALKIKVRCPAQDGRANQELIELLADRLGCRQADLQILRGDRIRQKLVLVRGLPPELAAQRLVDQFA